MDERQWEESLVPTPEGEFAERWFENQIESLKRLAHDGRGKDWTELTRAACAIWRTEIEEFENYSIISETLEGIVAGVYAAAVYSTAQLLQVNLDGMETVLSEFISDSKWHEGKDYSTLESLREICRIEGEKIADLRK